MISSLNLLALIHISVYDDSYMFLSYPWCIIYNQATVMDSLLYFTLILLYLCMNLALMRLYHVGSVCIS